jgi:hypothetical protein
VLNGSCRRNLHTPPKNAHVPSVLSVKEEQKAAQTNKMQLQTFNEID